ncbi:hypothetical protein Tco_0710066 [Tanacetum coccineum]
MLCKPKPFYDENKKVAIGYKNPLCLTRAKQVQSALYNGTEIVMTNHKPAVVHDLEETLEITELTRKIMYEKMKSPQCIQNKVKFVPPNYSKRNNLASSAPQRDIPLSRYFWAKDNNARKKVEASVLKPLSTPTMYPPNTPVKLVPRVLPTKSQVKINLYTLTQLFTEFDKTCKKRITPTGLIEGEIGVNTSTKASRSKPRSNTKKNRIWPAKSKNKKKVEDHPRTKKEGKQIWKPKGKLSDNSLKKALFANVGYQWRPTGKKFALGEQCPLTKLPVKCHTGRPLVSGLRLFKTYDGESFKAQELRRKVHRDSQIQE